MNNAGHRTIKYVSTINIRFTRYKDRSKYASFATEMKRLSINRDGSVRTGGEHVHHARAYTYVHACRNEHRTVLARELDLRLRGSL